jgi:hypothetical protein
MSFSRTLPGLAAEHLFYPEVLVYVEGYTDIPFYNTVLQNYNCRIKAKSGKPECEKLATLLEQNGYPYIVVLDGHYEILERTRSQHRRIVLLHRHSHENYLFEEEPIQQFCRDYARELVSRFREFVEIIEQKFKELIVLDVAHRRSGTGYKVLPDSPREFFAGQRTLDLLDDKIDKLCIEATQRIDIRSIAKARTLVEKFLEKRRFIDLLPGHFAFGIMWRLITNTVNESVSNREIRVYLSRVVWGLVKTRDHNSLKRRLRSAVREAEKIRQTSKSQT